ncbi:MAG: hypothetical protein KGD68_03640 [Candidatus Lokiarchaeota archaeon]|nr:hypothetical protein [Candidatus Lokiarchaeota archaeon]
MPFDFLLKDINSILTCKSIGTDKGLAKIGDGVVNLTYSIAKSIFLTKANKNNKNIRTGLKVSKKILAEALKKADMKKFSKSRADAHDLADTVEALIAYIWFYDKMTIEDIVNFLVDSLSGDLYIRSEEIQNATNAFTTLLLHIKKFLPES